MAQTGLTIVPLLLLSIVAVGQCAAPTACNGPAIYDIAVEYTANHQSASSPTWESDQESVVMSVEYEPRATRCLAKCKLVCKTRSSWSGCVAFSSWISESYSGQCYCYGWDEKPTFTSYSADYRSGWCETDYWETATF